MAIAILFSGMTVLAANSTSLVSDTTKTEVPGIVIFFSWRMLVCMLSSLIIVAKRILAIPKDGRC